MDIRKVFEANDNGQRVNNPALHARNMASNRIEAIDYDIYAQARVFDGKGHEDALLAVEENARLAKKNGWR